MPDPYHLQVRDAVRDALEAAALAAYPDHGLTGFLAQESPDPRFIDKPSVIVAFAGTEYEVGSTNVRDDIVFPVLVGLYTVKPDGPDGDPPGMTVLQFRQLVRTTFHNKRLSAVPEVYLCQYSGDESLFDAQSDAFKDLRTGAVVAATARVPRS